MDASPPVRSSPCKECQVEYPDDRTHCPHCGRYQKFPNVVAAQRPEERQELERRYAAALDQAELDGRKLQVEAFEVACRAGHAVLCCKREKLLAVARREHDLFASFYDLLSLRFNREPHAGEPDWNRVRPISEIALLGSDRNYNKLHYAALSLDDEGLPHYGDCHVLLRNEMIAHRTSAFEDNLAMYVERFGHTIPLGRRSDWECVSRLCIAKLGARITVGTTVNEFAEIVLKPAPSALDDQVIELHIFGEMTFHSFQKVRLQKTEVPRPSALTRSRRKRGLAAEKVLRDYCAKTLTNGVPVEFEVR